MAAGRKTGELHMTAAASDGHRRTQVAIRTGAVVLGRLLGVAFMAHLCYVHCADQGSLEDDLLQEPFRLLHSYLRRELHKCDRPKKVSFKDCKNDSTLPAKYLSFKPYTVIIGAMICIDYSRNCWHLIDSKQILDIIIRVILKRDIDLRKVKTLKPGESYVAKYGPFKLVERDDCLDTDWARQYRTEVPPDIFVSPIPLEKIKPPRDPSDALPASLYNEVPKDPSDAPRTLLHNVKTPFEENPFEESDEVEFDEEWFDVYIHKPKDGKDELQITLFLLTERESLFHAYLRYAVKFRCVSMEEFPGGRQGKEFPKVENGLGLKRLEDILFHGEREYKTMYFTYPNHAQFGYWHNGGVRRRHYDFESQALIGCSEGWAKSSTKETDRWAPQPKADYCWRKKWTKKGEFRDEMDGKVSVDLGGGRISNRFLNIKRSKSNLIEMKRRIVQTGSLPAEYDEILDLFQWIEELIPVDVLKWNQVRPQNAQSQSSALTPFLNLVYDQPQNSNRQSNEVHTKKHTKAFPLREGKSQFNTLTPFLNLVYVQPQNSNSQSIGFTSLKTPVSKGLATFTIFLTILVFVVVQERLRKREKMKRSQSLNSLPLKR